MFRTERCPVYCNPIDLDYGWGGFKQTKARAAADPVIVLFKDRYYLFSTHDTGGYRVSDDLVHWQNIAFAPEIRYAAQDGGRYVAPAVATDGKYIYFIRLKRDRAAKTTEVIRTVDPDSGRWEHCGDVRRVSDPTLFIDNGRFFIYHGLGTQQSIQCFEVDPETFEEIPGSERLLMPIIENVDDCEGGYHFGRREIYDEIDARDWIGHFKWLPSPEGAWTVRHGDRYYLQFATPGTISIWYADVVMEAASPEGPFTVSPYNLVSLKAGGFIGGAGHSSVFEDRYGNWWEITSMWVGNADPFERRLGLFPVSFDTKGRMNVHTRFGDYPMQVPQRKFDPETEASMGWNLLSYGKACSASSELEGTRRCSPVTRTCVRGGRRRAARPANGSAWISDVRCASRPCSSISPSRMSTRPAWRRIIRLIGFLRRSTASIGRRSSTKAVTARPIRTVSSISSGASRPVICVR